MHWRLDEARGLTANDSSGNTNHGVIGQDRWDKGHNHSTVDFQDGTNYILKDSLFTSPPEKLSSVFGLRPQTPVQRYYPIVQNIK